MRIYFIMTAILVIIALSFPALICTANKRNDSNNSFTKAEETTKSETITVLKTETGEKQKTDMTEYIIGVVAGEMPASFSPEALKAQAVVSYTYAKYTKEKGNDYITDSSALHQNYIDKKAQKAKWGDNYELYRSRIADAVEAVKGEYVSYEGKTALTAFHADSDGTTNSAEEIWEEAVPYLISVNSPSDVSFNKEVAFTPDEFKALFEEKGDLKITEKDTKKWALITKKDEDNHIRALKVAEKEFSAVEIMDILSLPSADFMGKIENGSLIFTVKGKGHGVGMSQYSAEYMAKNGKSYKEILAHFYPGTTIEKQ